MTRSSLESQLALVDRGIAETHADADRMWRRIAALRRSGRDTRYAEETLASFLVAHSVYAARRQIILIELEQAAERSDAA